ncbi:MAG: vitamin B12 dependent-methionine synthase activation domain-containing protein [Victivallaceae bacterium]
MADKINFINNIPLPVPERKIYSRLGHNRYLTEMSAAQRKKIESAISRGVSLCRLRGVWRRFEIKERTEEQIEFGDGNIFASRKLAELLKDSGSLVLFAVTAGTDIVAGAEELAVHSDGVGALTYDAVGSEMVDAAAEWIQQYLNRQLKRGNEILTKRRFSPGYGDLDLKNQALLFKLLEIEKLGVKLTKDFLMLPEKTVTAIAGIQKIENRVI